MQHSMTKNKIAQEIRLLNVTERLNLVTDIWDEIKESQELEMVSEEEKKLLVDRLDNYQENPSSATNWVDLKQEVYDKYAG